MDAASTTHPPVVVSLYLHRGSFSLRTLVSLCPQGLMHSAGPVGRHRQLVLVLEGELYLIPFALLKGSSSNEYLYERFSLICVPSLGSLTSTVKVGTPTGYSFFKLRF